MPWIETHITTAGVTKVVYCQPIYIYISQCEGPKSAKICARKRGYNMERSGTKKAKQTIVLKISSEARLSYNPMSLGQVHQSTSKTIARDITGRIQDSRWRAKVSSSGFAESCHIPCGESPRPGPNFPAWIWTEPQGWRRTAQ